MKKHKIRNVDIDVCCAEQKICYNLCFMFRDMFMESFKQVKDTPYLVNTFVTEVRDYLIDAWKTSPSFKAKYDIDLIHHCLYQGIENYFNGYSILTSYEEIGRTFKCLY